MCLTSRSFCVSSYWHRLRSHSQRCLMSYHNDVAFIPALAVSRVSRFLVGNVTDQAGVNCGNCKPGHGETFRHQYTRVYLDSKLLARDWHGQHVQLPFYIVSPARSTVKFPTYHPSCSHEIAPVHGGRSCDCQCVVWPIGPPSIVHPQTNSIYH